MTDTIREKARRRAVRDAAYRYDRSAVRSVEPCTGQALSAGQRQGVPCRTKSKSWIADIASKAYTMALVLSSPPCSDAEYDRRNAACADCPHCTIVDPGERFCECCGCPKWSEANLFRKNRRSKHRCPAEPPRF